MDAPALTVSTPTASAPQPSSPATSPDAEGAQVSAQNVKDAAKAVDEGDDLSPEFLDKRVTIKIDGKDHRMTVKEAIKLQQLEQASRAKMNQAAATEKNVRQLLSRLEDPMEYFRLRGIDPAEFAESTLAEKLKYLQMDPKEKELEELRKFRAETEKERQSRLEQENQAKQTESDTKQQGEFNNQFVEAWKSSGLPPDRLYGQMLAAEMVSANARREDLNWNEAAVKVKEKLKKTMRESFTTMDPEGIQEWLGQANLKRLREYDVKRVSQGTSNGKPRGPSKDVSEERAPTPKKYSEKEWREFWDK